METEGGSQLFETAGKGGFMQNGPLKGGGSCKYVSVIMKFNIKLVHYALRAYQGIFSLCFCRV